MVLRMNFSHNNFSRLVECDTVEQNIESDTAEFVMLTDGKQRGKFKFDTVTEKEKKFTVTISYMENGRVFERFSLSCK